MKLSRLCPLHESANQLVMAFLSRSGARVELYLLLTIHFFIPYFRKEVHIQLRGIRDFLLAVLVLKF